MFYSNSEMFVVCYIFHSRNIMSRALWEQIETALLGLSNGVGVLVNSNHLLK